jgi:hypothetical protein
MAAVKFSEAALAVLRLHFSGHSLMMGATGPESVPGHTVEETQAAYRELVAAGFMIAVGNQAEGHGARYWLTLAAIERKAEWLGLAPSGRRAAAVEPAAPAAG